MPSTSKEFKVGELAPQTGQYQCVICGHIMEFKTNEPFVICPVCQAGAVGGPRGPEEGVWILLN